MPPINVTSNNNNNNNNNIFSYIIDLEIQLYLNKINYKIALTYKKKGKSCAQQRFCFGIRRCKKLKGTPPSTTGYHIT